MDEYFECTRRVGFGDCDPAQIAYTGRIANFALDALDAFWEDLLGGEGWFQMNAEGGYGLPFVRIEYDFKSPIVPGAPLFLQVWPVRLGTSSVTMAVRGVHRGAVCFEAQFVSVFTDRASFAKIAAPDHVRAALLRSYPAIADAVSP
ncbi:acyl-CoA thioesterase [Salipiger sp. P9]|uniref:acyl-CoA thioesterase n=1 Tax=Salipiger pentaromativorans TaxID=2943193 RepID=UPI002156FACA|nr:thioesterase family protein [Salipiger pentaromativorans]MCR8549436.1 acyl-CoA thioesterase [Salipiger pentaromativorans]